MGLFPFVRRGNESAAIPLKDLIHCARRFTLPEIEIIGPKVVICLGNVAFFVLRRAAGVKGLMKVDEAINSSIEFKGARVHCVAHTGSMGMNNRGRAQVDEDWRRLAARLS